VAALLAVGLKALCSGFNLNSDREGSHSTQTGMKRQQTTISPLKYIDCRAFNGTQIGGIPMDDYLEIVRGPATVLQPHFHALDLLP